LSDIKVLEKLNDEIFATGAHDGIVNIWSTKQNRLLMSINVDEGGLSTMKYVQKRGVLICGHKGGFSVFSSRDNF
jgi:WD40 repeat protein